VFALAALLVVLGVVAVFASQNAHFVAMRFLGWQFTWPLAGIVLVTLVAGALAAFLVSLFRQVRLGLRIHDTSGRLRKAEKELETAKVDLDKTRADLALARRELEEARRPRAPGPSASPAPEAGGASPGPSPSRGGGPSGSGPRRG